MFVISIDSDPSAVLNNNVTRTSIPGVLKICTICPRAHRHEKGRKVTRCDCPTRSQKTWAHSCSPPGRESHASARRPPALPAFPRDAHFRPRGSSGTRPRGSTNQRSSAGAARERARTLVRRFESPPLPGCCPTSGPPLRGGGGEGDAREPRPTGPPRAPARSTYQTPRSRRPGLALPRAVPRGGARPPPRPPPPRSGPWPNGVRPRH